MSYYKQKKQALEFMEQYIRKVKNIEKEMLYLLMVRNYGYGKKIIDEHLKLLSFEGFVKIDNNMISWAVKK